MKKILKRKSPAAEAVVQPDHLSAAIGRIQQQLTFLEKKIDTLIAQSSVRPSGSFRHDRGGRDNSFRERSFTKAICAECKTECEVPFRPTGDRPVYCKECFVKHKDGSGGSFKTKFEHKHREGGFSKERNFDRPQARENRRPGGRKKPSFRRAKGRD